MWGSGGSDSAIGVTWLHSFPHYNAVSSSQSACMFESDSPHSSKERLFGWCCLQIYYVRSEDVVSFLERIYILLSLRVENTFNLIHAGKEVFVEILLILHLFASMWVYCQRGQRPFLYCVYHNKNRSYFFADYLMEGGMDGGRTMVRCGWGVLVHRHITEMMMCNTAKAAGAGRRSVVNCSLAGPRFKWALRVLWLKEWMADLTDYFCSFQTAMLGRQIQVCERQLRRLSLIDFLEGSVTSAAPSTFHFNQLPTAMFHMCFRWLGGKTVFPLYLTDTLHTTTDDPETFFLLLSFPLFLSPVSSSCLLISSPAFLSTCSVPLVHPSSLNFFTSGYK